MVIHGVLTREELIALAASARVMMMADGSITEGESDIVARFAPRLELTNEDWSGVWDEAQRRLPTIETVQTAVGSLRRREARELVYELLYELATDGSISDPEWDLLEWLDATWLAGS